MMFSPGYRHHVVCGMDRILGAMSLIVNKYFQLSIAQRNMGNKSHINGLMGD